MGRRAAAARYRDGSIAAAALVGWGWVVWGRRSLAKSGGQRREAEQTIGLHAQRDVVVPARLAKLTKYVRGNVHLLLSSMSVQKRRDEIDV